MAQIKIYAAVIIVVLAAAQGHYAYSTEVPKVLPSQEQENARFVPSPEQEKADVNILSLEQCIGLAFENNPGLQIEREKITELENDYRIASSGLYPKVTASAYYARGNPDHTTIQPIMQYAEESLGQGKLKQLLYDGGKTGYNGRAADRKSV